MKATEIQWSITTILSCYLNIVELEAPTLCFSWIDILVRSDALNLKTQSLILGYIFEINVPTLLNYEESITQLKNKSEC